MTTITKQLEQVNKLMESFQNGEITREEADIKIKEVLEEETT